MKEEGFEEKLFFVDIPGLKLVELAESYSIHEAENPLIPTKDKSDESLRDLGMQHIARLMKWKDKKKAQELFFEHTSFKDFGKLSDPEVQERLIKKEGLLILSTLLFICFQHYVGEHLLGSDTKVSN